MMAAVLPTNPYGRKILVQSIPSKATEDKLCIHFQKKKNGGQGDVVVILYPKSKTEPNQAVVEFENPETVFSILQHHHEMFDEKMQVTAYDEPAFGFTQAQLSVSAVTALSQGPIPLREKLNSVASQSGVEIGQQKPYVIIGQFEQVREAFDLIEALLEDYRLQQSKEYNESFPFSSRKDEENYPKPAIVSIQRPVFAFWRQAHPSHFETLKKKYKVDVEVSDTSVVFKPKQMAAMSETTKAQKKFEEMYKKFSGSVCHTSTHLRSIVGVEGSNLQKALDTFHQKSKSYIESDGTTLRAYSYSVEDADASLKLLQEILIGMSRNKEMLEIKMDKTDLKVIVVHGDICKEKVSVLINEGSTTSLNEVMTSGGKEMIEEFLKKNNSLGRNPQGKFIQTSPGKNLQCDRVVHYCSSKGARVDLCDILVNAFMLIENELKAQTVTLPMHCIGANIPNPKEEVMNFILKFNSKLSSLPRHNINQIRILHPEEKRSAKFAKFFKQLKSEWASNLASSPSGVETKEDPVEDCVICLDELSTSGPKLKKLECNHVFHQSCIDKALNITKKCPTCMRFYGTPDGNQPKDGQMSHRVSNVKLPGFSCSTIEITYYFPSGVQGPEHPNPGVPYRGTSRLAYLPNNPEGREVLLLLQKAFRSRITFTVGRSVTTGIDNCVTWNDIHHKTSPSGGASHFGYPDPTYLQRVKQELASKGITIP